MCLSQPVRPRHPEIERRGSRRAFLSFDAGQVADVERRVTSAQGTMAS